VLLKKILQKKLKNLSQQKKCQIAKTSKKQVGFNLTFTFCNTLKIYAVTKMRLSSSQSKIMKPAYKFKKTASTHVIIKTVSPLGQKLQLQSQLKQKLPLQ